MVSVEGRGSVVNVEGFLDISRESLIPPHQGLGVIHGVSMTSGLGVFHGGRVGVFSICMFSEPCAQHSHCLTDIFLVTFVALHTVYHLTPFFLLRFVFGDHQQGPYDVERFAIRGYTVESTYPM